MRAMVLERVGEPLVLREVEVPQPGKGEVRIKVAVCGVCRTDLHIVDEELVASQLPLILGHQVVGTIDKLGENVTRWREGDRVGLPWLGNSCGSCEFCRSSRENLCDDPTFTGYTCNGGYADYCTAQADFLLEIPSFFDDLHAAPLLCAGLIGYRAFRLVQPAETMGFYGFGSSAHILIQVATALNHRVYVFTRPGDQATQQFALTLGATWAGGSDTLPPTSLDAAIIFAPVGALYPEALRAVKKGGKVLSAGIHMSPIPSFPYALLWGERSISSVANLTRQDGVDFMELVKKLSLNISVTAFPLEEANSALTAIRDGTLEGSAVLTI